MILAPSPTAALQELQSRMEKACAGAEAMLKALRDENTVLKADNAALLAENARLHALHAELSRRLDGTIQQLALVLEEGK
jgi:hypothetical protein